MLRPSPTFAAFALTLALYACDDAPSPASEEGASSAPAAPSKEPTAPAPTAPKAEIVPGRSLGPITLGAPPPADPDGSRARADGSKVVYWSTLGLEAVLGPKSTVVEAAGHDPVGDPFYREAFAGKTAQGVGIGSSAAEVANAFGDGVARAQPSPFVEGARAIEHPERGIAFVLSAEGKVITVRISPLKTATK